MADALNRFVPPSMPVAGLPRIAVVMAKLMVEGEDFGIRPVVVALSDGFQMCKGVTSRYALIPVLSILKIETKEERYR
jgi:hypothetical protein